MENKPQSQVRSLIYALSYFISSHLDIEPWVNRAELFSQQVFLAPARKTIGTVLLAYLTRPLMKHSACHALGARMV